MIDYSGTLVLKWLERLHCLLLSFSWMPQNLLWPPLVLAVY